MALARDEIARPSDGGRVRLGDVRSVTRDEGGAARVTRRDGSEVVIAAPPSVTVDDARFGRVRVSWAAVDRADLGTGGPGPAYADFAPGRRLAGTVTTRDGRRLTGRLVIDLDESETTETLDASAGGVDYGLPLGRVASVVLGDGSALVTLTSGETLRLDPTGDLGDGNAGVLVFGDAERPTFVPWADVARLDLDRQRGER